MIEVIEKLNNSVNILAVIVIGLGVAISFKQPATGHDLIIGGLGSLGGAAAGKRSVPNE
jgi:hypothetical protein